MEKRAEMRIPKTAEGITKEPDCGESSERYESNHLVVRQGTIHRIYVER